MYINVTIIVYKGFLNFISKPFVHTESVGKISPFSRGKICGFDVLFIAANCGKCAQHLDYNIFYSWFFRL